MTDASGNADHAWDDFDPEAYFSHYYGEPHEDDDAMVREVRSAFARLAPRASPLDVVDVGTGPGLISLMCSLPDARRTTALEYSRNNVEWLRREISRDGLRPAWAHFWDRIRDGRDDLPADPTALLKEKVEIERGSVFELPKGRWDAATMFFCAESITRRRDEFDIACRRFAGCVRPGGILIAAFLVGSGGSYGEERPLPVLGISPDDVRRTFETLATDVRVVPIGIVAEEIRKAYSGMAVLSARSLGPIPDQEFGA